MTTTTANDTPATPTVGAGATVYGYSDREAYTVIAVAPGGRKCTLHQLYGPNRTGVVTNDVDSPATRTRHASLPLPPVVVGYVVALRMVGCPPWALLWTTNGPPPPLPALSAL